MNTPRALALLFLGLTSVPAIVAQARPDSSGGEQATAMQLPSVDLPPELARVLRDYETAYRRSGFAVAELFTEDGFVLSGGRPPIRGRAAIAEYYGAGRGPLALRAIAFAAEGSVGYIIGGYARDRAAVDAGKFTLTLRKRPDGRWLIVSDMDNSNRRP
jgi:ketosteroid isomerase-like protein